MKNVFIVGWPEIQYLMGQRGFRENAELIEGGSDYEKYGDCAFYVNEEWLDGLCDEIKSMVGYD